MSCCFQWLSGVACCTVSQFVSCKVCICQQKPCSTATVKRLHISLTILIRLSCAHRTSMCMLLHVSVCRPMVVGGHPAAPPCPQPPPSGTPWMTAAMPLQGGSPRLAGLGPLPLQAAGLHLSLAGFLLLLEVPAVWGTKHLCCCVQKDLSAS